MTINVNTNALAQAIGLGLAWYATSSKLTPLDSSTVGSLGNYLGKSAI